MNYIDIKRKIIDERYKATKGWDGLLETIETIEHSHAAGFDMSEKLNLAMTMAYELLGSCDDVVEYGRSLGYPDHEVTGNFLPRRD